MTGKNLLIVEDEFIVAADLKLTLVRWGFTVVHITSYVEFYGGQIAGD